MDIALVLATIGTALWNLLLLLGAAILGASLAYIVWLVAFNRGKFEWLFERNWGRVELTHEREWARTWQLNQLLYPDLRNYYESHAPYIKRLTPAHHENIYSYSTHLHGGTKDLVENFRPYYPHVRAKANDIQRWQNIGVWPNVESYGTHLHTGTKDLVENWRPVLPRIRTQADEVERWRNIGVWRNVESYGTHLHDSVNQYVRDYHSAMPATIAESKSWADTKKEPWFSNIKNFSVSLLALATALLTNPFIFLFDTVKAIIEALLFWLFDRLLWVVDVLW